MTKPTNLISIEKATGKSMDWWVQELDNSGARDMSHGEIAKFLFEKLDKSGMNSPGWWAQGITVAYEQLTGRRVPGQLANGLFEMTISKTILESRDSYFPKVSSWLQSQPNFNGQTYSKPRSSETPKRSNWRCDFADGSKFTASVEVNGDKSKLVLAHTAIPTQQESAAWKYYWSNIMGELQNLSASAVR